MPRQDYEERREARIERLKVRAENAQSKSDQHYETATQMGKAIPFGQPILVGHHSEKADRNFRSRIHGHMDKCVEESHNATHYEDKAKAAENNRAISSDDPEAVTKLKEKIEKAERFQENMKAINKIVRSKPKNEETPEKLERLATLLNKEPFECAVFFQADFAGRIGVPSYKLTNNNANLKRMKDRLAQLIVSENAETFETEYSGFKVVENAEENRIQIIFDGKDEYFDLCKNKGINLKREGFNYSKNTGVWQRFLNNRSRTVVQCIVKTITN